MIDEELVKKHYADFSPVPDEKGDTHIYYALDKLYKYRDKWHIVKEGE